MNAPQKIAVAKDISADLVRIGNELVELMADADACAFHRATLRLRRAAELVGMVEVNLRVQAKKMENRTE